MRQSLADPASFPIGLDGLFHAEMEKQFENGREYEELYRPVWRPYALMTPL